MRIAQPAKLLAYLPLYLAIEESDYELLSYDNAKSAIEAVSKGEADISIGDPFMFNYLNYERLGILLFAGFARKVFHSLIAFNPFIHAATKKYLAGKTIVSYPEPSTAFFLCKNLKKEYRLGNIMETPFNTELGPLLTQEADVAIVTEPNTTYALRNGAKELINFSSTEMVMTGLCVTKPYYEKNMKKLRSFLDTLQKGIESFHANESLTLVIAKKYFPLVDEAILVEAIHNLREMRLYCDDFRFTERDIQEGVRIRQISLPLEKIKKYITYLG